MYEPAPHTERETFLGYLGDQLDAIRSAPYGLTEQQARSTPCRSALSLAALVKHAARGLRQTAASLTADGPPAAFTEADYAEYQAHLRVADHESVADLLTAFDAARDAFTAVAAGVDPDAERLAPPAPWHGVLEPRPIRTRFVLWHQVEEFARHAGHADIIREQIDGTSVATLVLTRQGAPAGPFFTPFAAAPGTLTV